MLEAAFWYEAHAKKNERIKHGHTTAGNAKVWNVTQWQSRPGTARAAKMERRPERSKKIIAASAEMVS